MPPADTRRALPTDFRRPTDAALDHLTDPSVTSGNTGTSGNAVTSGTGVSREVTAKRSRPPSEHVRLPRPIVDEMRDAVWFLAEHGRPRLTLVEILEEAVTAWLTETKQAQNGGEPFPRRGALR